MLKKNVNTLSSFGRHGGVCDGRGDERLNVAVSKTVGRIGAWIQIPPSAMCPMTAARLEGKPVQKK